ncbi:MAG: hypothetical protein AABY22_27880, partial [Nanoarchaeota archaeon]
MYESLRLFYSDKFSLYWLCLDKETYNTVVKIPYIKPFFVNNFWKSKQYGSEFEKAINNPPCAYGNRWSQFCWTMTPWFIWYLLHNKFAKELFYVDSDIYFYHSPDLIV